MPPGDGRATRLNTPRPLIPLSFIMVSDLPRSPSQTLRGHGELCVQAELGLRMAFPSATWEREQFSEGYQIPPDPPLKKGGILRSFRVRTSPQLTAQSSKLKTHSPQLKAHSSKLKAHSPNPPPPAAYFVSAARPAPAWRWRLMALMPSTSRKKAAMTRNRATIPMRPLPTVASSKD